MRSAADAVAYARRYTSWRTQYCLNAVQTWLGAPWSGPWAMWAWEHARHKHPGDRNAPPGVPVYWSSASSKYGHIALSVGGGRVRSTDYPSRGRVGEASIDAITRWGTRYTYQGWAGDIGGQTIPGVGAPVAGAAPLGGYTTGTVYQHVCREGVRDMDSVRNVQRRLVELGYGEHLPTVVSRGPTGNWPSGGETTAAVRAWQRDKRQGGDWATGRKLGFQQAQLMFRGTGMVIRP